MQTVVIPVNEYREKFVMRKALLSIVPLMCAALVGCAEEPFSGNPSDVKTIDRDQAYLHISMDGGPLMFQKLKFARDLSTDSSQSGATGHGDTLALQFAAFTDTEHGLMATTEPFTIHGSGVGSLPVIMNDGVWGRIVITPLPGNTEYDFDRLELELFDPAATVSVKEFGAQQNARIEITFPTNVRIGVRDRLTGETDVIPSTGTSFELLTGYDAE